MAAIDMSVKIRHAREADRFYGVFLILLALACVAAPLFVEATLAWALLLAGLVGLSWLLLDRSPRGFLAAAGWSVLAAGLGYHLAFHGLLEVSRLALTLGGGFVLLGAAEIVFGLRRYRRVRPARVSLMIGGGAAVAFGLSTQLLWPNVPGWAGVATVAAMFAAFGLALLLGAEAET